ncbi:hypothetical protein ACFVIM_13820 [Streptomyces sp. NPDC057638]|uniref:hypothetical protein n=1 Tax=Streptomyces sp. NPDC057638 TaxID=3346190 RepID=UPI00367DA131
MVAVPNRQLAALMDEYGFTQQGLADEINRAIAEIYGERHPQNCAARHVRRWLQGEVGWPWERYLVALERIFGRTAREMGFVPRGKSSRMPTPPPPSPVREEERVLRRQFITASTTTTVVTALGIEETPQRGRVSMSDIARVRERIGRLDAHFLSIGGAPLIEVATAYIDRLHTVLDSCTYGERVEKELHRAISDLYSTAGWSAHDSGDAGQAGQLYSGCLQSALLAADPTATAVAWSNLSIHARFRGRHREALTMSRAALSNRRAGQDPRIATLLHARLAISHARVADQAAMARSLLTAEQAYDRVTGSPSASWLTFLTEAEVSGLGAIAHEALGRHDRAERAVVQTLELLPPSMRRNRAYYLSRLASLQLAQGEREQAAATVAEVTRTALDIPRVRERLAPIERNLAAP